ncbi:PREDICTED: FBD-associated F-box protein At4g10400-like [Brassica oleracea var. oleracea]|uniref:FBD-associated F-box protein At4g10400-like n=1 Tax=Brassica oleracea var. oleracea TaxID=109376 RepID=UPI0006A7020F|nr:PREDICTED: FBD-associated F-box protein At4g10400-like [Brassica oleracea var. oleracea]
MDRISELSDELLVKILLLVPTKVAVSTSILSKRWKYLWMWLPKLEFSYRHVVDPECERLQSFLDRNLRLHRAPVIESFRFYICCSCLKPKNIKMWVSTAVSHCLRELDISRRSDPPDKPDILPSILFTCKSLVVLKLAGGILLDVPRMVSLPSLKTLQLRRVRYFNEETLQRLLSNCPVLEDLVLVLSNGDTTGKLTVVVSSLLSLSLYLSHYLKIDGYVIETPSLKYFKLVEDSCRNHYCLIENMPFLVEALDVNLPDINSLIGSIASVKRLEICSEAIMMLDEGFVFNQLEHLEVCLCKDHSYNQLVRLLNSSSNLQGLRLFYMDIHYTPKRGYWNQPTTVPECLLSSLQSLSWSLYTGEPQERDSLVYILKHALHLKTAIVESCECEVPRSEMLKELELSYRASAACQLMFE